MQKKAFSFAVGALLLSAGAVSAATLTDNLNLRSGPGLRFDVIGAVPTVETVTNAAVMLDTIKVKHVSGGHSIIGLKTYASGREKFQGETLDWVWFDEEPPADIYTEGLTRTNVGANPVWMTFTPLLGVSTVVKRFLHEKSEDRHKTIMTIDHVEHYNDDEKRKIIASYPAHEAEARVKGIPVLGSGRVFPVAEENIAIDQRDFPSHWPRIGGMDFGWDHPFAAVEIVWDRGSDVVYLARTHRLCRNAQGMGQGVAVGMAARRQSRDFGRCGRCPCQAIQTSGPEYAA